SSMALSASSVGSFDFCGIFAIFGRRLVVTPDTLAESPDRHKKRALTRRAPTFAGRLCRMIKPRFAATVNSIALSVRKKPRW
ncbi:MAG TPA: hypothetical protein VI251_16245, partial [Pseudolabrys sp.]